LKVNQLKSVLNYISDQKALQNTIILDYFMKKPENCGIAPYCINSEKQTDKKTITIRNAKRFSSRKFEFKKFKTKSIINKMTLSTPFNNY
jgi:hypothetical protein